jgi:hypothetical protein
MEPARIPGSQVDSGARYTHQKKIFPPVDVIDISFKTERPQANRIIEMVLSGGVTLFHDQTGKSYACLPVDSHRQVRPVDGR